MPKKFWILDFDIYLTFACLPRPRSINSAGPGPVDRDFEIWGLRIFIVFPRIASSLGRRET